MVIAQLPIKPKEKMKTLKSNEHDLVDFAYRINKQMGAYLHFLLRHEYVFVKYDYEFNQLLEHLQTNKDFNLITGFESNRMKGVIWLDSISKALKEQFSNQVR